MSYSNKSPFTIDNTNGRVGVGKAPTALLDIAGLVSADSTISSLASAGNTGFKVVEGALIGLDGSSTNFLKVDATTHGVVLQSNVTDGSSNAALIINSINTLTGTASLLTLSIAGTPTWKFSPTRLIFPDGSFMTSAGGGGSFDGGTILNPLTIQTDANIGSTLYVNSNDDGSGDVFVVNQANTAGYAGMDAYVDGSRMFGLNGFGVDYSNSAYQDHIALEQNGHMLIFDGGSGFPVYFYADGSVRVSNTLFANSGIQFSDDTVQTTAATGGGGGGDAFWTMLTESGPLSYTNTAVNFDTLVDAGNGGTPAVGHSYGEGETVLQSQSGAMMIQQSVSYDESPNCSTMLWVDDGWNQNYGSTLIYPDGHTEIVADPTNFGVDFGGSNYWMGVGCPLDSGFAFYGFPQDANDAATGFAHCWKFDWTAKTWTQLADGPTDVATFAVNTGTGKILVAGGTYGAGGDAHGTTGFFLYDIASDTWSNASTTDAPASQYVVSMLLLPFSGRIVIFGVGGGFGVTDTAEYDPSTDEWFTGTSSPLGFDFGNAGGQGGFSSGLKAFATWDGGAMVFDAAGHVQKYMPGFWAWSQSMDMSGVPENQWCWGVNLFDNTYGICGYGDRSFYIFHQNQSVVDVSGIIVGGGVPQYASMTSAGSVVFANLEGEHPVNNRIAVGNFTEETIGGARNTRLDISGPSTLLKGTNDPSYPEVVVSSDKGSSGSVMQWKNGPEGGSLLVDISVERTSINNPLYINALPFPCFAVDSDAGASGAIRLGTTGYEDTLELDPLKGYVNIRQILRLGSDYEGIEPSALSVRALVQPTSSPDWTTISAIKAELYNANDEGTGDGLTSFKQYGIEARAINKCTDTTNLMAAISTYTEHSPSASSGGANTIHSMIGLHVKKNTTPTSQPVQRNAGIWIQTQDITTTEASYAVAYGNLEGEGAGFTMWAVDYNGKQKWNAVDNTATPGDNNADTYTTGKCKIAAAATSVVITNSLVGVDTIVDLTINQATEDLTLTRLTWTASAGSFTVYGNAAATADVQIAWSIKN